MLSRRRAAYRPGRQYSSVQTGTGLLRSQLRSAQNLASMIEALRPKPPAPTPVARQTQAEASDDTAASKVAATTAETRIRPMKHSSS
jgi:hypothetical protein